MQTRAAFNLVYGITMHFKQADYSMIKYGADTKKSRAAYDALSPAQKRRYEWLSEKYSKTQDLVYCIIGNILKGYDVRFENSETISDEYYKFKSRREGLEYFLKTDISTESFYENHSLISVLNRYFGGKISPEYVILKFYETGELHQAYEDPKYSYCHARILQLLKYRDFIPVAKYKHLFENHEEFA